MCSSDGSPCTGVDPEFQQDAARVIELAEKAMDTWSVLDTDFLAPPVVWAATAALANVAGLVVRAWGGYPQVFDQRTVFHKQLSLPCIIRCVHLARSHTTRSVLHFGQSKQCIMRPRRSDVG